jgi:hypothetical protein
MTHFLWPREFAPSSEALRVAPHTRGNTADEAPVSAARGGGAMWRLSFTVPPQCLEDAFRLRAFVHGLEGASNFAGFNAAASGTSDGGYSDGTLFTDGTGYETTRVDASTTAALAKGADVITLSSGTAIVGSIIRIYDAAELGYLSQTVIVTNVAGAVLTFKPALRYAIARPFVDFSTSFVYCRFTNDPVVPIVAGSRSAAIDIDGEEAF